MLDLDHAPPDLTSVGEMVTFSVSGRAAHGRIAPLLPPDWVDVGPYAIRLPPSRSRSPPSASVDSDKNNDDDPSRQSSNCDFIVPRFIWENAPRRETRPHRDGARAYSHLPNGTSVLDDKWALARLLPGRGTAVENGPCDGTAIGDLAPLESHCFRGPDGFRKFCNSVGMFAAESRVRSEEESAGAEVCRFPDLLDWHPSSTQSPHPPPPPPPENLWVVKDASSNGAGGIWVVDPSNAGSFLSKKSSPSCGAAPPLLIEGHRYVAQRYAWPPVLYGGRKCHARVYGLITSDGRAYVHRRCFLHVANELFAYGGSCGSKGNNATKCDDSKIGLGAAAKKDDGTDVCGGNAGAFDPSMHITNCCANSHDASKFAGEICADLSVHPFDKNAPTIQVEGEDIGVVPLGEFLPSVSASLAALASRSMPYLGGGEANGGFEYLGMDFILSRKGTNHHPTAYLLEVNAPPSQDTATGLRHAEDLHDDVLRDLISLWVVPRLVPSALSRPGGWKLVLENDSSNRENSRSDCNPIIPSKAAILNKVRWAMVERRMSRQYEQESKLMPAVPVTACGDGDLCRGPVGGLMQYGGNTEESMPTIAADDGINSKKASLTADEVCAFARSQFPYFSYANVNKDSAPECLNNDGQKASILDRSAQPAVFLESAGGSQVPYHVIHSVTSSLSQRHRSSEGTRHVASARRTLLSLLGASPSSHRLFLGGNATSLINSLAVTMAESGFLLEGDEVVISSENHRANVDPWVRAARKVGARVKWWTAPYCLREDRHTDKSGADVENKGDDCGDYSSPCLSDLLSPRKTRIVAVSHASNLLGMVRDIRAVARLVQKRTEGRAQVVVDGVAAVPHVPADLSGKLAMALSGKGTDQGSNCCDGVVHWYAVSCHKAFGPHLGCLCGTHGAVEGVTRGNGVGAPAYHSPGIAHDDDGSWLRSVLERGTLNYESCAGIMGVALYFQSLAGSCSSPEVIGVTNLQPMARGSGIIEGVDMCSRLQRIIASRPMYCLTSPMQTSHENTGEEPQVRSRVGSGKTSSVNSLPVILSLDQVERAYRNILLVESRILEYILPALRSSSERVRILGEFDTTSGCFKNCCRQLEIAPADYGETNINLQPDVSRGDIGRIPLVSFVHERIDSSQIARVCLEGGIICRAGTFLATERLLEEQHIICMEDKSLGSKNISGVVRLSFAHYNTLEDAQRVISALKSIEGW